ncbi:peroxiredoxin family protein [Nocardia sp. NPDC056100]|uniref:peroxiredoxin family protein n=1 Tax=Nocardia sp. NPDC056100 TaxID=3345712 RepID=UPI0035D7E5FD
MWAARLVAATVFGWAGTAKLLEPSGTREAVGQFGVSDRWVPTVIWTLPAAELMVALALLPSWTAVPAAIVALGLLALFSLLVARLLRRGERPSCSCFGSSSTQAIGPKTLVRNAILAALVLAVLVGSVAGGAVPQTLPLGYAAGLVAIVALGTVQLWQGNTIRRMRTEIAEIQAARAPRRGLSAGTQAPEFDLPDTAGGRVALRDVLTGGRTVALLFLHPGCGPCATVAAELARWRAELADQYSIVVVGTHDRVANTEWARMHGAGTMLVQQEGEVYAHYRIPGTPAAVLIDPDGRVTAPPAVGSHAIREVFDGAGRPPLAQRATG